jgi:hypothetical protein
MRANGRPGDVHDARRGMDVHHGLNGSRRVSVERADHSRIVADRGGHGYVQHPYNYHGREYAHRTYYDHGRAYDRFYNRYQVHGVFVEVYAPAAYFAPGFYGFVYNPWVAPVAYSWGFAATPWFGAYGFYFTPMPVYPTASLWLTDYMISQSLAAGYQAQVAAGAAAQQAAAGAAPEPAPDGAVALTPDVKQMIAAEVQRQIALENQEAQQTAQHQDIDPASSGVGRLLSDNAEHVFVVGNDLDLVDASGTECAMSEGDVLQLPGPPAADATAADLVVVTSKGGQECRKGSSVSVGLADLQDMQNHMRETIDAGMADLQNNQSKGGLPALPASAKAAPVKAEFAAVAPPPDPNAGDQINAQAKEADVSEKEVLADAQSGPSDGGAAAPAAAPAGPPKTIGLGQTIDEVTGILGQPKSVVDLGAKKIYVYPDMKITFNNGKVTDVQ